MTIDISQYIDYTLLKADADINDFQELCKDAADNSFCSVCVPPYMIKRCKDYLSGSDIKVATVIAFPLGYTETDIKVCEIKKALETGADEVDAVINISALKSGDFQYVQRELDQLRDVSKGKILKIIIETCYLNKEEIISVSKLVSDSGADFIKTSTGFGKYGARFEDIEIMKANISDAVKIKASGGIKTYTQALEYIKKGVSRIGTSSLLLK